MPQNPTLPPKWPRSGVTFHFHFFVRSSQKRSPNAEEFFIEFKFGMFRNASFVNKVQFKYLQGTVISN